MGILRLQQRKDKYVPTQQGCVFKSKGMWMSLPLLPSTVNTHVVMENLNLTAVARHYYRAAMDRVGQ